MKFTADRGALADVVSWVAQVIPKNPVNAAVSGVRLSLSGTTLTVTATDYDTTHQAVMDVLGQDDGDALVPGFMLRDLVGALRGQDVGIVADDKELLLTAGRSTYRSRLLPLDDFPAPLTINRKGKGAVSVGVTDAEDLKAAVNAVLHLVDESANESVRGLRIETTDDGLTLVGAQSAALAIAHSPLSKRGKVELGVQLPGGVFNKAVRGLAGAVKISHSEGVVELADAERCVTFRTYATEFVKWRTILRGDHDYVVDVSGPDLLDAVRRSVLTYTGADKEVAPVDLHFEGGELHVTTAGDTANGLELLDVDSEAHDGTDVRLSSHLIRPALASFAGRVRVGMMPGQTKAVILTSLDDEPVMHVVMPRRKS